MNYKSTHIKMPVQALAQSKGYKAASAVDLPLEVSMLLDVLSRIETRRQEKLHSIGRK